jgi:hypothetical protein
VNKQAFRVFMLLTIVGAATAALADPPPHPRYKWTNKTPWTISGTFTAWYCPMGKIMADTPIELNGTMAPNQSLERQFPDRIPHLSGNVSYPSAFANLRLTHMVINGTAVNHVSGNSGACGYTSGDRAVSPGETASFANYASSCVKVSCSGGSSDVNAQDYLDCEIRN